MLVEDRVDDDRYERGKESTSLDLGDEDEE